MSHMGYCPRCGITLTMGDPGENTDEKKHIALHDKQDLEASE